MSSFLLVNPRSGDSSPSAGALRSAAEAAGIRVHVLEPGDDPAALAREADAEALGVAGGDGSLAAVAGVALERGLPFVCVPFGTRNHFARDVGLNRDDPVAALAAFEGRETRIDVGRIGERVFLNNVSLGAYAHLVHRRERHRRRREALVRLRALGALAAGARPLQLRFDGRPASPRIALIANNAYRLDLFTLGARERLDGGLLHVYEAPGVIPRSWTQWSAQRTVLEAEPARLRVAIDGEPVEVETPVEIRAEPQALRLLLPPALEDERDVLEGQLGA